MTLPEPDLALTWVGKTVVDRGGEEVGVCRAVLTDDGTGFPEWLYAEVEDRTVIVPLLGATESGEHVQVQVEGDQARSAPRPAGDTQHLSQAEEAALYRHYGIEYSRSVSDTVLPVGDVEPAGQDFPATSSEEADGGFLPSAAAGRGGRAAAAVAVLAALGAVVAVVLRRRRRPQPAAVRAGRRARAASSSAKEQADRLATWVVPVAVTAGRLLGRGTSAGAAVALRAGQATARSAAGAVPRVTARGAEVAGAGLRAVGKAGGALEVVPKTLSESGEQLQKGWRKAMSRLSLGVGLAVGYVFGARAGRERFEQIRSAAVRLSERPEVQEALSRVQSAAPARLQGVLGTLSQRTSQRRVVAVDSEGVGVVAPPASSTHAVVPPESAPPPGGIGDDPGAPS
jgi:hypothetical protein